jgi:hypothetical protein|eukprot:COSAG01_NODE_3333_length_6238_cov_5.009448_4_plen_93_part_00
MASPATPPARPLPMAMMVGLAEDTAEALVWKALQDTPLRSQPVVCEEVYLLHSCACIGSPCLRHCVHGASIGVPAAWARQGRDVCGPVRHVR